LNLGFFSGGTGAWTTSSAFLSLKFAGAHVL